MKKKKKITGKRGRPPKYITDDKGREIVGVGWHPTGQYYITHSNPRIYLGHDENHAIAKYNQWVRINGLPKKVQDEAKRKDDIYEKAMELISYDCNIRDQVRQTATDLLNQQILQKLYLSINIENMIQKAYQQKLATNTDLNILINDISSAIYYKLVPESVKNIVRDKEKGYDKVIKLINEWIYSKALKYILEEGKIVSQWRRSLNSDIDDIIFEKIKTEAKTYYQKEGQESLVWERAYDLIMKDPIKASKMLGIKEVAYLALFKINDEHFIPNPSRMPLPWWFVWWLYTYYVDQPRAHGYLGVVWKCTGMGFGIDTDVEKVSVRNVVKAVNFDVFFAYENFHLASKYFPSSEFITFQYSFLPQSTYRRLQVIRYILKKVCDAGYDQCLRLYKSLMELTPHTLSEITGIV